MPRRRRKRDNGLAAAIFVLPLQPHCAHDADVFTADSTLAFEYDSDGVAMLPSLQALPETMNDVLEHMETRHAAGLRLLRAAAVRSTKLCPAATAPPPHVSSATDFPPLSADSAAGAGGASAGSPPVSVPGGEPAPPEPAATGKPAGKVERVLLRVIASGHLTLICHVRLRAVCTASRRALSSPLAWLPLALPLKPTLTLPGFGYHPPHRACLDALGAAYLHMANGRPPFVKLIGGGLTESGWPPHDAAAAAFPPGALLSGLQVSGTAGARRAVATTTPPTAAPAPFSPRVGTAITAGFLAAQAAQAYMSRALGKGGPAAPYSFPVATGHKHTLAFAAVASPWAALPEPSTVLAEAPRSLQALLSSFSVQPLWKGAPPMARPIHFSNLSPDTAKLQTLLGRQFALQTALGESDESGIMLWAKEWNGATLGHLPLRMADFARRAGLSTKEAPLLPLLFSPPHATCHGFNGFHGNPRVVAVTPWTAAANTEACVAELAWCVTETAEEGSFLGDKLENLQKLRSSNCVSLSSECHVWYPGLCSARLSDGRVFASYHDARYTIRFNISAYDDVLLVTASHTNLSSLEPWHY